MRLDVRSHVLQVWKWGVGYTMKEEIYKQSGYRQRTGVRCPRRYTRRHQASRVDRHAQASPPVCTPKTRGLMNNRQYNHRLADDKNLNTAYQQRMCVISSCGGVITKNDKTRIPGGRARHNKASDRPVWDVEGTRVCNMYVMGMKSLM